MKRWKGESMAEPPLTSGGKQELACYRFSLGRQEKGIILCHCEAKPWQAHLIIPCVILNEGKKLKRQKGIFHCAALHSELGIIRRTDKKTTRSSGGSFYLVFD